MKFQILESRYYFRYLRSLNEFNFIKDNHIILSINEIGTYWTTLLTNDPDFAQRKLSLPEPPKFRVGGFEFSEIDRSMIVKENIVAPAFGLEGGAKEYIFKSPIVIKSIFSFDEGIIESFFSEL